MTKKFEEVNAEPTRVEFQPVIKLEEASKVGFFTEQRPDDDTMLEPMFRLCCESKDGESKPIILTPWSTAQNLSAMVQGCMYLYPLIIRCIKENQKNAEVPKEEA